MDAIRYAARLDAEFSQSCTILNHDEPWFGEFGLKVHGEIREFKIGRLRVLSHLSSSRMVACRGRMTPRRWTSTTTWSSTRHRTSAPWN
jgi:hypothetical protein